MFARFTSHLRSLSTLERAVYLLALIALGMTVYYLGALMIAQQVFNGVSGIFWAMGRAILNRYTMYEDIFETKPPLLFVLSAASLTLFGNQSLGTVLHTILLFAVPFGVALYAQRRLRAAGNHSAVLVLTAFLFGTLLVRYLSRHPTAWAIEFYGLAFSMLYLLVLADAKQISWKRVGVLTIFLIGAIGMKESFLLVVLSGALLVASSVQQWVRGVFIPLILTAIIGICTLAFMGSLDAYLTIYLPEMFGYYVQRHYIPFILKGVAFDKVFSNVAAFSVSFLLLILAASIMPILARATNHDERTMVWTWVLRIVALLCLSLLSATSFIFLTTQGLLLILVGLLLYRMLKLKVRDGHAAYLWSILAAGLMLGIRYVCSALRFVGAAVGQDIPSAVCVSDTFVALTLLAMAIATFCAVVCVLRMARTSGERALLLAVSFVLVSCLLFYTIILLGIQIPFLWTTIFFPAWVLLVLVRWWRTEHVSERQVLLSIGRWFAAAFVVIWSISMGTDYQGHHFLSVIPFLLAVFLLVLDALSVRVTDGVGRRRALWWLASVSLVILLNPLRHPSLDHLSDALQVSRQELVVYQAQADRIDAILDACLLDRYFLIGAGDVYGFTRHTPQNFFLWAALNAIEHHPVVSERTFRSLAQAQIIFIGSSLPPPEQRSEAEKGSLMYIEKRFTETPWMCAADVGPPIGLQIFYRIDRTDKSPVISDTSSSDRSGLLAK